MNIVITAGGTSERIDDVRRITNSSTGSLGLAIGREFIKKLPGQGHTVYYLHGERAPYPEVPEERREEIKLIPVKIGGVMDLKNELERVLKSEKIDAVIHAMAVSDYMVHQVTTLDKLMGTENPEQAQDLGGNKISSNIDDLIVHMKKSPKVIGIIKKTAPAVRLVGFKLLSGVPREELINVGYSLLQKNDCEYVMANDLREISGGMHRGYLIHRDKSYDIMETKEEIAEMIVRRILE